MDLGEDEVWRVVKSNVYGARVEEWFTGASFGRVDGPWKVTYILDTELIIEEWVTEPSDPGPAHTIGLPLSRVGGPARRVLGWNGSVVEEEWRVNDRLHRVDGPATREDLFLDDHLFTSPRKFAKKLGSWKWKRLTRELRNSSLAPLLDEGVGPRSIVKVLGEGVFTAEGIREVLAGAPPEWVRSFEAGAP